MTKVKMIATDSVLIGAEMKHAGEDFEVDGEKNVEKMKKAGHLVADTKEADAFLAKKGGKKSHATKMTEKPKPSKHAFNSEKIEGDDDEVQVKKPKTDAKAAKKSNKKGSGDLA